MASRFEPLVCPPGPCLDVVDKFNKLLEAENSRIRRCIAEARHELQKALQGLAVEIGKAEDGLENGQGNPSSVKVMRTLYAVFDEKNKDTLKALIKEK